MGTGPKQLRSLIFRLGALDLILKNMKEEVMIFRNQNAKDFQIQV